MKLNQSIINDYNEFGVVVIRDVLSSYWLEQLSIGIDKNFNNPCLLYTSDAADE